MQQSGGLIEKELATKWIEHKERESGPCPNLR